MEEKSYKAEKIQVLEGLEAVRKRFNIIGLSNKIKKRGDILKLSKELNIKPRSLYLAKDEGKILSQFPDLDKSKASVLTRLKTLRELQLFSKKYDINNLSVRDLVKFVKKWNKDIQKNPLLLINKKEHDLIIGSLLGDSSIRQRDKNSCFRFFHSIKQKKYSIWKLKILNKFNISEFREVKRKIINKQIHGIDFATKTHPIFNYYRNLFYKNNKKEITEKILKQINPRSLAIWICDDGSFNKKQKYITLCTNSFNLKQHRLIKEFFNKKFRLDPTIGFRDKKYYYLRFKKQDSKKLINIIKPRIPICMSYKIGE